MENLEKLVNKQHRFILFLEKPLGQNRRLHIDRVFAEVQHLHGVVHEIKVDHNEVFDTMTISWTEEWFRHKYRRNPMMWILHFNCIKTFKKG